MKRRLPIIIIIFIFLIGLGVLSYPLVSSIINNLNDRSEARQVEEKVQLMDEAEVNKLFSEAEDYNRSLTDTVVLTDPFDIDSYEKIGAHYGETFDLDGSGFIGYIDIPSIDVYLPIYHGTSDEVLKRGAGHLENTSLPIGGVSTHSVISAHSAFPGKTLFDYLTDVKEGDVFRIHVLDRVLTYRVDQIMTVLPENVSELYVIKGRDLVTLMTCTPYSVNTHRLLVRGERVEIADDSGDDEEEEIEKSAVSVGSDKGSVYILGYKVSYTALFVAIGVFVAAVIAVVLILVLRAKKRRKDGE